MATYRFIEPLDVLYLRGNKLFGDPGSFGESLVPPWPSVAAGAIRSLMLATDGVDPAEFARGALVHPTLGTPTDPGSFTLTAFHLARRKGRDVQTLHLPPADLAISAEVPDQPRVQRMHPASPPGLASSAPLPQVPVLAEPERRKPASGYWLTQAGWATYMAGRVPTAADLVRSADLWALDPRVGVGLSAETGRADDGKLFSVQAVAFKRDVGFVAGVSGANPPSAGTLRLGGDGRGAAITVVDHTPPEPDAAALCAAGRCRLVLTSPGLFDQGWLPTGTAADNCFELLGVRARIVCAAVPRAEVASGFDLARWTPKPAQRLAPAGSVYWLEDLQATPAQLRKLAEHGLWPADAQNASRRAEGFNRFTFAAF